MPEEKDVDDEIEKELAEFVAEEEEKGEIDEDELAKLQEQEKRGHVIPKADPLNDYGPEFPTT